MTTPLPRPSMWTVLLRGWRRRCPRCGDGALFDGWFSLRELCNVCALPLERMGDLWGFWIIGDRIFVVIPMVLLFFGFRPETLAVRMLFLVLILIPLVWTMPHRLGVCLSIDCLLRTRLHDPDFGKSAGESSEK